MNPIFDAACEVCAFMKSRRWKYCVIGGLAVQRWGAPRLTQDADLSLLTGFGKEASYIDALLRRFAPRCKDAFGFAMANRVLLLYVGHNIPVDITLATLPYEAEIIENATLFAFDSEVRLPTCSADDLFIMKIFAARDKDWLDAEGIVVRQGARLRRRYILSRLKDLCEATERPETLTAASRMLGGKPWKK